MKENNSGIKKEKLYYFSISLFLKKHFNGKVRKVSLDAGFSCPNRRGKEREGGCFWCDPQGSGNGSDPEFWQKILKEETEKLIQKGYKGSIAYFQAFTNTFGELYKLKEFYTKALKTKGVLGLAVGTRPDCLSDEIVELLASLNRENFLWIEIGMQTMHDKTLELCNRGHSHKKTVETVLKLKEKGIRTVLHLIVGLPGETEEMIFASFQECAKLSPWGVKLHPLHIVKGSVFEKWFYEGKIRLLEMKEYANLAASFLEVVSPEMVIHRLTGERPDGILVAPRWCLEKNKVKDEIIKILNKRNSFQGKMFRGIYG